MKIVTNRNHHVPKGTSDEHYTPAHLFTALQLLFDLDVAAPQGGSKHVPATHYYDKTADGLKQNWWGNIWMNPPYSNPTPWVDKFIEHRNGVALLPITRGRWWDRIWRECDAVVPLVYNFAFERPDNLPAKPIVFRTALYAFGAENVKGLHRLNQRVR